MLLLIVPITALLSGVALLLLGTGLLNTVLALRGDLEGYTAGSIGLIMSGYFLGFFVGTFIALPLIQRIGHIRCFALCAALASCSTLSHALLVNPVAWFGLRVLTGTMLVILYTVIESWLNAQTPPEQRGRVFAIYMVVNLLALAAAQQLLPLASPASFTLFAVAAMLVSVSLAPVAWTRMTPPTVHPTGRLKVRLLYKRTPVAMAAALLSGLAMGAFWGLGAVYAKLIGLSASGVATFMSCAIIGGALLQLPLGKYSDTHDRRLVLAYASGAAAVAALLLTLLSYAGYWVLLAITLYGGLAFTTYPLAIAHLADNLNAEEILPGGSALLLVHGIGAALGPALAGRLVEIFGAQALPSYFLLAQVAIALFALWKIRTAQLLHEEPEITENTAHFIPMVRTTPTGLEMLPEETTTSNE